MANNFSVMRSFLAFVFIACQHSIVKAWLVFRDAFVSCESLSDSVFVDNGPFFDLAMIDYGNVNIEFLADSILFCLMEG